MKILRRSRRGLAATAATALALGMVASQAPSFAEPLTSSPWVIDGAVPDDMTVKFTDPSGSSAELGPLNSSSTKLGVVHTAPLPMLAPTNPNSQVDLNNVWLETAADDSGDIWLYLAWQRDSNRGSGVIMYEFMQDAKPVACDYSKIGTQTEAELIAACNPFANRQPGDFILVWDQQGGATAIGMRTWGYSDLDGDEVYDPGTEPLTLGVTKTLAAGDDAEARYSTDKYRGEATVNLSDTIFPETPTSCFTVGNVVPGTITGNSDTADYKDVVLDNFTDAVSISNCGSVKVTKVTDPAGGSGSFAYTLARDGDDPVDYADPPKTERTGTLTEDGDSETQLDLRAATDYTLAEDITEGAYDLGSIVCTFDDEDPIDVTDGSTFPVAASEVTSCVITNDLKQGILYVKKVLKNDNGGTKAVTDFSFTATGQNGGEPITFESDGTNSFTVDAGTYDVAEVGVPIAGYATTYDNCADVVVPAGGSATCTITNDDIQPQLKVTKTVVNDNGGMAVVEDFPLYVGDTKVVSGETNSFDAGTYQLSETAQTGYSPSTWGGDCTADGEVTLAVGDATKECTITNDDQAGTLIVNKVVVNDNGGALLPSDFSFSVNEGSAVAFEADGSNSLTVNAGTYSVTEPDVAGYTMTANTCVDVVVPNGGTQECTITNDDQPGTLTVNKVVVNNNGGKLAADAFSFSVNGGTPVAFEADGSNTLTVNAGTFDVTEPTVAGYTMTDNTCTGIVVVNGGSASCTITNDDQPGTLIVDKVVVNDNGGTLAPDAFSFSVNGGTPAGFEADGSNAITVDAGTYDVTEPTVAGYTQIGNTCVDVVVGNGETKECTITNDDQPGTLIVNKVVVNDNGGALAASDFTFSVNGGSAVAFEADGSNSLTVSAGTYSVTEPTVAGYTQTRNTCVDVVVGNGETKECTITNDDTKASPSGDTIQNWVLHDSLVINNLRAGATDAATAQATFTLYEGSTCAAEDVVSSETVFVTGTQAVTVDGIEVWSPGEYHWRVTYTGDQYNNGFTTDCAAEVTFIEANDFMNDLPNLLVGP